jgi:hypothetical protein
MDAQGTTRLLSVLSLIVSTISAGSAYLTWQATEAQRAQYINTIDYRVTANEDWDLTISQTSGAAYALHLVEIRPTFMNEDGKPVKGSALKVDIGRYMDSNAALPRYLVGGLEQKLCLTAPPDGDQKACVQLSLAELDLAYTVETDKRTKTVRQD